MFSTDDGVRWCLRIHFLLYSPPRKGPANFTARIARLFKNYESKMHQHRRTAHQCPEESQAKFFSSENPSSSKSRDLGSLQVPTSLAAYLRLIKLYIFVSSSYASTTSRLVVSEDYRAETSPSSSLLSAFIWPRTAP